jgi:hypothetical protein
MDKLVKPTLSICIVSYNTREYLKDCLDSLVRHAPLASFEIIVIDNHSKDGSHDMVLHDYANVQLRILPAHEGYTRAMNHALRIAQGSYLVQLNPDTLVNESVWDALIGFMKSHPEVGICTPKVLNSDGTLQKQCRRSSAGPWDTFCYVSGLSRWFPHDRRFAGYLMTYMDEDVIHPCDAVSGSCMVIKRKVVEKIGYLDEAYYAYQEDSDYCFRARQAGFQVYYVPLGVITHFGGRGGSLIHARKSIYEWHRSYWVYYRKHIAPSHLFIINCLVYLGIGLRLAIKMTGSLLKRQKYIGSKKP